MTAVEMVRSGDLESYAVAAQIAATVVAAIVAVVGSIIGAILGAKEGANATRGATLLAIEADARAAQERRREEDRAALLALAAECRINAATLRVDDGTYPDPRFLVPLRQTAFSTAASALAGLDKEMQDVAQKASSDVSWFNQLVASRLIALNVGLMSQPRENFEPSYLKAMEPLMNSIPTALDDLASRIEERFGRQDKAL